MTALRTLAAAALLAGALALPAAAPPDPPPPACPKSTPAPAAGNKCSLAAPSDPEFASICHPGAMVRPPRATPPPCLASKCY